MIISSVCVCVMRVKKGGEENRDMHILKTVTLKYTLEINTINCVLATFLMKKGLYLLQID